MFRSDKTIERINLLELDAAVGRSNAGAGFAIAVLVSFLISAGVVGAAYAYFALTTDQITKDTAAVQAEMDSPQVQARLAAVDDTERRLTDLNAYGDDLKLADGNFKSHPKFTTEILETIEENLRPYRAEWTNLSYGQGYMTLLCIANEYLDPAQIAASFIEQDFFDNVTYTGFTFNDDEERTANPFEFTLTFQIREKPEEIVEEIVIEEVVEE
jgi:quinol monooxygenase YgiN